MTVGNRTFSGKGARNEAAKALTHSVLTWRDDQALQPRGSFRGFEILSKGKSSGFGLVQDDDRLPDLFVRGRATYPANLNATNPIGTVQSVEHTLRNLDTAALDLQDRVTRIEKELADYRLQADRPFEHEERLKALRVRQTELDSLLDLNKGDRQGAAPIQERDETDVEWTTHPPLASHERVAKMAAAYMHESGTAIRNMPISERMAPERGQLTAKAVARDESHIAFATAANSFFVVPSNTLLSEVRVGERLSLRFHEGTLSIGNERDRTR